jgi:hypothetical protein
MTVCTYFADDENNVDILVGRNSHFSSGTAVYE